MFTFSESRAMKFKQKNLTAFKGCRYKIDYQSYLSQYDIVFKKPIKNGCDGLPIGNGDLAAVIWTPDHFKCIINKSDVWSREDGDSMPVSCCQVLIKSIPSLIGNLSEFEGRLSLYNGEATFNLKRDKFQGAIRSYVHSKRNIMCIDLALKNNPSKTEIELSRWLNPSFKKLVSGDDNKQIWLQYESHTGFKYAVAMGISGCNYKIEQLDSRKLIGREVVIAPNQKIHCQLYISVVTSEESPDPLKQAITLVKRTMRQDQDIFFRSHGEWWSDFWSRSFVDTGQDYLNNLWYFNIYQLASCSRGKYPPKFNGALWIWNEDKRPWGGSYWCLNQTRSFWQIYAANHIKLGEPLFNMISNMLPQVKKETRDRFGIEGAWFCEVVDKKGRADKGSESDIYYILSSGMTYALMLWLRYQYTLDKEFLRTKCYPLLKECVLFYENYLRKEADGKYHISPCLAWEERPVGEDSIPDISAVRSGVKALLEASKILERDKKKREKWQDILDNIAEYPVWKDMFAQIKSLGKPHPIAHFQWQVPNLANVFPFGLVGLGSPEYDIAVNTYNRLKYCQDAGHAMLPIVASRLGLREDTRRSLWHHINLFQWMKQGHFHYGYRIQIEDSDQMIPYLESGGILTTAVNEMLLQSHQGVIRIFPAFPNHWRGRFSLRAVGSFLVSSEIKDGEVKYIVIENLGGGNRICRIANCWNERPIIKDVSTGKRIAGFQIADGEIVLSTVSSHSYFISKKEGLKRSRFYIVSGKKNQQPKLMGNALLGDFKGNRHHDHNQIVW